MKLCGLVLCLCAVAGSAQTPSQNAAPKLEPYQAKALENALRKPDAGAPNRFSGTFATQTGPILMLVPPVARVEAANACAIPLLSVPFNPDMDLGIRHELKPGALTADPMPTFEGLPVCGLENARVR
jgi:hypothetical protein